MSQASDCWVELWGHTWVHPFIPGREGEMGARSLPQYPTGSCQTCWLQQQERISQVWTQKRSTGGDPPLFHISSLVSPSFLLPLMSHRLFLQTVQEIQFSLHVAGRQRNRNPPAKHDIAKNCHEGPLTTRSPKTFGITTFQPPIRSCWKGRRQKPAKTTRNEESTSPERKANN